MFEFLARLVLGGLIVALVPTVAARLGPGVAGVMVLVPVITLLSFASLGAAAGSQPVERAALGALVALPASAVYLGVTYWTLRTGWPIAAALSVGLAVWLCCAVPLAITIARLRA
jgi:uncharacterized membrane protein (GlpM family)